MITSQWLRPCENTQIDSIKRCLWPCFPHLTIRLSSLKGDFVLCSSCKDFHCPELTWIIYWVPYGWTAGGFATNNSDAGNPSQQPVASSRKGWDWAGLWGRTDFNRPLSLFSVCLAQCFPSGLVWEGGTKGRNKAEEGVTWKLGGERKGWAEHGLGLGRQAAWAWTTLYHFLPVRQWASRLASGARDSEWPFPNSIYSAWTDMHTSNEWNHNSCVFQI